MILPGPGGSPIGVNLISTVVTPVQGKISEVVASWQEQQTQRRYNTTLELEYNKVVSQNALLKTQVDQLEEMKRENIELKALLGVAQEMQVKDPIQARVISRDPDNWFSVVTINRGTLHGVEANMIVVNADGLVGRILSAGLNTSKVLTIIDSRSAVSAVVERTRDNGTVKGILVGQELTGDQCRMYRMPLEMDARPGDLVKTAGMDGIYPKALTIGVISEMSRPDGQEQYVIINPLVDFAHLEEVLVIQGETDIPEDEASP